MSCSQCRALERMVESTEREYIDARRRVDAIGTDSGLFNYAQRLAEEARQHYDAARLELEQHQRVHSADVQ